MHSRTLIIAEAGVNHNGSLDLAMKLVDEAAAAGADAVKFQSFVATESISRFAEKAEYQRVQTGAAESQLEMVKKLELKPEWHQLLQARATERGIIFLSTAFDFSSVDLLHSLNVTLFKIPSGELTNLPLLRKIASVAKDVILSTGMATLEEVKTVVEIFVDLGIPRKCITVLHCNTEYPTPMADVNLRALHTLGQALNTSIGYSDHTLGIEVPIAAVALGATVIEKHFTLDQNMPGPDHRASLEPRELRAMVAAIRNIESALGDGMKRPSKSEARNIPIVRKSIVARKQIRKGEVFTEENLATKRPGTGISPMEWDRVIGSSAHRDFQEDELIELQRSENENRPS